MLFNPLTVTIANPTLRKSFLLRDVIYQRKETLWYGLVREKYH